MGADERKKGSTEAMKEAGLDALRVYGNAWQGDYLRYTTNFGILEGQALAIVRSDGHITLYVDSKDRSLGGPEIRQRLALTEQRLLALKRDTPRAVRSASAVPLPVGAPVGGLAATASSVAYLPVSAPRLGFWAVAPRAWLTPSPPRRARPVRPAQPAVSARSLTSGRPGLWSAWVLTSP